MPLLLLLLLIPPPHLPIDAGSSHGSWETDQDPIMGRTTGVKMPSFCLNRIRPHARVRSPPVQSKNDPKTSLKNEDSGDVIKPPIGRKIMIVVDSSMEAKGAVQWALTHTVQSHDIVILLHVTKPSNQG